jgi:putative aminopeptidase FrvX
MHSVIEVADLRDVERVVDLLEGFVRSLGAGERFEVKV